MNFVSGQSSLLEGLHRSDIQAIKTLFGMHYRPLCYFAETIVHTRAEAEDIAVESFLKFLDHKEDFKNLSHIKSFLFTTVRNACVDFLRKEKVRKQHGEMLSFHLAGDDSAFKSEMITAQLLQTIYAEIEHLPAQCRRVFKSIYVDGKSTTTIAHEMGIKPQTVLNQKVKAIRMLRLILSRKGLSFGRSLLIILPSLSQLK